MAQRPLPRHVLIRSPSAGSGLRPHPPTDSSSSCSSVLYIPTGGEDASRDTQNVRLVRPAPSTECHRTGLQMSVNVDEPPPLPPRQPQPPTHTTARLFSPRLQPKAPTHSLTPERSMLVMNTKGATPQMPSITCRDNVLEIRPAAGDCCVRVNAGMGGKVRIKIPSTQQSSRVTRFRIADSLKLYGEAEGQSTIADLNYRNYAPDIHFASPPPALRFAGASGVGIRRERRPSDEAERAAARARKRYSYAFEGDHEEALHESRIDNFVLESLNEVCDTSVKSESKIFHILASKIEKQGPEAGNLWTAFSIPELINFLKILEIEEKDMKKAVIFKYKLLKYRISKLMSAQRKLSQ